MGKTVPSYRIALEFEIQRWKDFRKALNSEEDREAFDELMEMCRNNVIASNNVCKPRNLRAHSNVDSASSPKKLEKLTAKKLS
jgi:hypothetical protein